MKKIILVLLLAVTCTAVSFGYSAFTYSFIIDASASVSHSDFDEANENIAAAISYLYDQAGRNPGLMANQISVAWFGGQDDYNWIDYCNGSNYSDMKYLYDSTLYKSHPDYGATAIYSAIAYSALIALDLEEALDTDYFNVFFLITDGEDGDSPSSHKEFVRSLFPASDAYLCVIGVGDRADVSEFYSIADEVVMLDDFGDLFSTIATIQELF